MKIPTNTSILDWLAKYALFVIIVIAALFIIKSFVASAIKAVHNSTLAACTINNLADGDVVTYSGTSFIVDDIKLYEYEMIDDSLSISLRERK